MFQKEFAHRLVARPGSRIYSRISVTSQYYYEIKILREVSRGLFSPPPKVDSSFVMIKKKDVSPLTECEDTLLNLLFTHKKRTLRNAIKYALSVFSGFSNFHISSKGNEGKVHEDEVDKVKIDRLTDVFSRLDNEILNQRVFKIDGEKLIEGCKVFCRTLENET